MLYRFLIISNEVEDFMREIKINADATFLQLNNAILQSCGYDDKEITSFTICDDDWEKEQEITLEEMDTSSDQDSYVMAKILIIPDDPDKKDVYDELRHSIVKFNNSQNEVEIDMTRTTSFGDMLQTNLPTGEAADLILRFPAEGAARLALQQFIVFGHLFYLWV